jgi:hypothetical protein
MSRNTPAAVARQLRQEAGFGCCECGIPIIHYHHIVEWADDQHFRPEDMMVLCPFHHIQATQGAMPVEIQRKVKTNPKNIREGYAKGLLKIWQKYCAIGVGSNILVNEGPVVRIDGSNLLECYLGDENLELSLRLYSKESDLLVEIDKNEWKSGDPLPWDIEAAFQRLTIRQRKGEISLSLDAKQIPMELRAQFWFGGKYIELARDRIFIGTRNVSLTGGFAAVGGPLEINRDTVGIASGGQIIVGQNNR